MSRLVFLLEEQSMKILLETLLPRCLPEMPFVCVAHEGKQDLEKSIPRKLRAWCEPDVRFIIVRDNDGGDCHALKKRLTHLCETSGRSDAMVRIACQELEAWYLGDADALAAAFGNELLRNIGKKARYRNPDTIQQPSREVAKLIPAFQKVSGARRMGHTLSRHDNRSRSFQVFMDGVEREYSSTQSTI